MSEAVVGGLRWVKGEIGLALGRVTAIVESYGQGGDASRMDDAAEALHEVRGVLLALSLGVPARLAEEMEYLCDAAGEHRVDAPAAAAEALLLALIRLSAHLDQLDAGVQDPPDALWTAIDDLRSLHAVGPLDAVERARIAGPGGSRTAPVPADFEALAGVLRQMRPRFHRALLEWYRPVSGGDGLAQLGLLFIQIQDRLGPGLVADLFRLAQAHAGALRSGDLPADPAARVLLGQLDRVFKPMTEIPPQWPGTDALRLAESLLALLVAAGLEPALTAELEPRYGGAAPAVLPEGAADALAGLAAAALGELTALKGLLDDFVAGPRDDPAPLSALAAGLDELALTLEVAAAGRLPERLRALGDGFRGLSRADVSGATPGLEVLAAEVLAIEGSLASYADRRGPLGLDLSALGFDAAELVAATLREVGTEFAAVKDAIVACQTDPARPDAFAGLPQRLRSVAGALEVLGQVGPARLCNGLADHIEHAYLDTQRVLQGEEIELLAEAVAALELHSERVAEGEPADAQLIRRGELALSGLAALVGAGPEADAGSVPVAVPGSAPVLAPLSAPASSPLTGPVPTPVSIQAPPPESRPAPITAETPARGPDAAAFGQADAPAAATSGGAPAPVHPALAPASEFLEVFLEEAAEELKVVAEQFGRWRDDLLDEQSLTRLRRSLHTLKGSGRMVGLWRVGDLAWAAENLCNRLIDHSLNIDAGVLAWIGEVVARLPGVVAAEARGEAVEIDDLTARAHGLVRGEEAGAATAPSPPAVQGATLALAPAFTDHTSLFAADEALLGIFRAETLGHLGGLQAFLDQAGLLPGLPAPETLRAIHTLGGSAHMAGIDSIAVVARLLERRLGGLAARGLGPDPTFLAALRRAVAAMTERLAELPAAGPAAAALMALATELELPETPVDTAASSSTGVGVPSSGSADWGLSPAAERFGDADAADGIDELPSLDLPDFGTLLDEVMPPSLDLGEEELGELPVLAPVSGSATLTLGDADTESGLAPDTGFAEELPTLIQTGTVAPLGPPGVESSFSVEAVRPEDLPPLTLPEMAIPPVSPRVGAAAGSREDGPAPGPAADGVTADRSGEPAETLFADAARAPAGPRVVPTPAAPPFVAAPSSESGTPAADCDPCPEDQEMLGVFLEEARDLLDVIDSRFRAWQLAPQDIGQLDAINRLLHTLKGGARLTGLRGIGNLSHALETRLTGVANGPAHVDDRTLELAQQAVDALATQFDALEQRAPIPRAADLAAALSAPCESGPVTVPAAPDRAILTPAPRPEPATRAVPEAVSLLEPVPERATWRLPEPRPASESAPPLDWESAPPLDWEAAPDSELESDSETAPEVPAAELAAFLRTAVPTAGADATAMGAPSQVRVRSDQIDRLVDNAGEIALYRARLSQRNGLLGLSLGELDQTVRRLGEQLRLLEMETEAQILFRFERESESAGEGAVFDPLELDRFSTLQHLSRSLAETVNDLASLRDVLGGYQRDSADLLTQQARLADDLQDGLLRTRMVPFVQVVPRLHRLVRQTAEDLGKSARLTVIGPEVELDRVILNRLVAPLEHLLRNAVDHGLESAEVRLAAGKPAAGALTLELSREGSEVVIRLSDDGPGLDLAAIRARALARGLLPPEAEPDDAALSLLVFEPGFTTQTRVTQISGRGVGLDVVASEIKSANGSFDLQSTAGRGLSFSIRLPLTLAIVKALLVGVGSTVYALPFAALESAARIARDELAAIYEAQAGGELRDFVHRGRNYRVVYLGSLLDPRVQPDPGESRWAPLLLVRFGEQRIAVQVDTLMETARVLVKPLAARLGALRWLAGGSILPDGRVALILDLLALLRGGLFQERRPARGEPALTLTAGPEAPARACVMVVDDSLTVRRVTTRMLEHRHIEVMTAKDGVEALTLLDERLPDLILLDVEMPRMDGYELIRHIRQSERLRALPVIMITSRTGAKHRDHALSLGVDRYLGKPYQEGELLDEIAAVLRERRR